MLAVEELHKSWQQQIRDVHANLVMSTMIDHDHIVKLSIRRVEEMGSGAAYCQLMDLLYPGEDNVAIIIRHDMISK